MANTSATGGPLTPESAITAPLNGRDLNRFFQQWLLGLAGLDATMVRPRWLEEGSNIPEAGECWMAFGITQREISLFPYIAHDPDADDGNGADTLSHTEKLNLTLSFYDTGSTGEADAACSMLRDGLLVPQNVEPLTLAGMALVDIGNTIIVPSLLAQRWRYRVDIEIGISRVITRQYAVRNLLSAQATVTPNGEPQTQGAALVDDQGNPLTDGNGNTIYDAPQGLAPYVNTVTSN